VTIGGGGKGWLYIVQDPREMGKETRGFIRIQEKGKGEGLKMSQERERQCNFQGVRSLLHIQYSKRGCTIKEGERGIGVGLYIQKV
jgi:hypothetical protein